MKKILLHVCCAPCAIYVVKQLQNDYQVSMFFYNPNIQPEEEYLRRRREVEKWSEREKLDLIISPYKPNDWLENVQGYEEEPEGGKRCEICYRMRLTDTAKYATLNNFDFFTTTLSISPHKETVLINRIGQEVAEAIKQDINQGIISGSPVDFLVADWKKDDGFRKSCALSHAEGFYRQDYCGCLYSQRNNHNEA